MRPRGYRNSGDANKYTIFWMSVLPALKNMLVNCDEPQELQLSEDLFELLGNRKSYAFNLEYTEGVQSNNIGGSAVARDLNKLIQADAVATTLIRYGKIKINMGKDFILKVRRI